MAAVAAAPPSRLSRVPALAALALRRPPASVRDAVRALVVAGPPPRAGGTTADCKRLFAPSNGVRSGPSFWSLASEPLRFAVVESSDAAAAAAARALCSVVTAYGLSEWPGSAAGIAAAVAESGWTVAGAAAASSVVVALAAALRDGSSSSLAAAAAIRGLADAVAPLSDAASAGRRADVLLRGFPSGEQRAVLDALEGGGAAIGPAASAACAAIAAALAREPESWWRVAAVLAALPRLAASCCDACASESAPGTEALSLAAWAVGPSSEAPASLDLADGSVALCVAGSAWVSAAELGMLCRHHQRLLRCAGVT